MHLEEAMRHEVDRLETELLDIDVQLEKLHRRIEMLVAERKKKEHDLRALKNSFTEADETLENLLKERQKVGL